MANAVMTKAGREKLCKAHAGEAALPAITQMALGKGGVDAEGNVLEVTGEETGLKQQLVKREIDGYSFPDSTTCRYSLRLEKAELVNESISEQGLFDEEGTLIAYRTFSPKGKDADMEFVFDMDEMF